MSEAVMCPECKRSYAFKPELAGKSVKCKCGHRFRFPAQAATPQKNALCPHCQAPMAASAVLCTQCGFNRQTNKLIPAAAAGVRPAGPPSEAKANGMRSSKGVRLGAGVAAALVLAVGGWVIFRQISGSAGTGKPPRPAPQTLASDQPVGGANASTQPGNAATASSPAAAPALAPVDAGLAPTVLLVQKDGSVMEGKILARDAQGLSVLVDGKSSQPPVPVAADQVARVIQIDDHGAEVAEAGGMNVPAPRPEPHWNVPAEPAAPPLSAAPPGPTYYVIPLHGVVGETYLADALDKSLADAEKRKPTVVVLDINSPGGMVSEAELMVKTLHKYNKDLRIVALADQDLSASAITSLSVRGIYMKSTGTFGAATAFDSSPFGTPMDIQEKFQSAWRAVARGSAEEGGHEPLLAEAMIDNSMALHLETVDGKQVVKEGPGPNMLTKPGKILTLTSHEAVNCGLAADIADDFEELGRELNLQGWKECPGLGTLLADYIPKRRAAFMQKAQEIGADFKANMAAAQSAAPADGAVTQRVFVGGAGGPGSRIITQTRTLTPEQRAHWNGQSLAAVVALQKVEQNLQDEMSLASAFGQQGVAEELKEPLATLAEARARLYSERNKYAADPLAITAGTAPPLALKNAPLPAKLAEIVKQAVANKNYKAAPSATGIFLNNAVEDLAPDGGVLIGLRCGMDNFAQKDIITSLQPVFLTAKGVVLGPVRGNPDASPVINLVARDGYAVGGAKISGIGTIDGLQLQFVRMGDGGLIASDSYDSDAIGKLDKPLTMGNTMPIVGLATRPINSLALTFTLIFMNPPESNPISTQPAAGRPATSPAKPPVLPTTQPRNPAAPRGSAPSPARPPAYGNTAGTIPPLILKNASLPAELSAFVKQAVDKKNYGAGATNTQVVMAGNGVEDICADGGVLIGLRCGMSKLGPDDFITSLQPVYLTAKGVVMGPVRGNAAAQPVYDLVARDGYAVGGAKIDGFGHLDGLQLRFVRIANGRLDHLDSYESDPIGKFDRPMTLGNALPAVGLLCDVTSPFNITFDLLSVKPPEPKPISALPAVSGPVVPQAAAFAAAVKDAAAKKMYQASATAGSDLPRTDFEEIAPDGGILIGLRCGKGKLNGLEIIASIQPIFLTTHGEVLGPIHGDAAATPVEEIKAPPGYAVGAIKIVGLVALDSLTVTFMKIGDRILLVDEAYTANRIGHGAIASPAPNIMPSKTIILGGDGTPVIGINGKDGHQDRVALGLVYLTPTEMANGRQEGKWP